jgi:hypothetical protein
LLRILTVKNSTKRPGGPLPCPVNQCRQPSALKSEGLFSCFLWSWFFAHGAQTYRSAIPRVPALTLADFGHLPKLSGALATTMGRSPGAGAAQSQTGRCHEESPTFLKAPSAPRAATCRTQERENRGKQVFPRGGIFRAFTSGHETPPRSPGRHRKCPR